MSKAEKAVEWSIREDDSEDLLRQRQRDNATTQRQMDTRKRAERRLKATSVLNYLLCLANLVF